MIQGYSTSPSTTRAYLNDPQNPQNHVPDLCSHPALPCLALPPNENALYLPLCRNLALALLEYPYHTIQARRQLDNNRPRASQSRTRLPLTLSRSHPRWIGGVPRGGLEGRDGLVRVRVSVILCSSVHIVFSYQPNCDRIGQNRTGQEQKRVRKGESGI